MSAELTLIIPFRNEGIEVYNTVESIKKYPGTELYIILINDASDDGYNYKKVSETFETEYIEHKISRGVAASRDHGVTICKTEYFMFLDAHMRVFTPDWASIILEELKKDKRAVFCCQTVAINREGVQTNPRAKGFGAHIDFSNLTYDWNSKDLSNNQTVSEIPCIMGASYSCNKSYWKKLRGLEGLRSYGCDEQLISIKALLEGGTCKLIKSVVFGHMFRILKEVPYEIKTVDYIFNQLYIMEILYPNDKKIIYFRYVKSHCEESLFEQALEELKMLKNEILEVKKYYETIFTKDFSYLVDFNNLYLV